MPDASDAVDLLCGMRDRLLLAVTVLITMGVLLLLTLPFVSPDDEVFVVVLIDAALIVVLLCFFGGTYWYCTRRAMEE